MWRGKGYEWNTHKEGQGKWASQEIMWYHNQQTYIEVSVGPWASYWEFRNMGPSSLTTWGKTMKTRSFPNCQEHIPGSECPGDQRRQMLFLPGTSIQRLFPGWHRKGMMTLMTTGVRTRTCLGSSMHSLCFHKPFFLPLRTFGGKSEPTDPGCWRRVKAGKVPWTVLAINRKDIFKQKWFSKSPWKETKGFSQMNPG